MSAAATRTEAGFLEDGKQVPRSVWSLLPEKIIRRRLAFPVAVEDGSRRGRLVVAMANPADLEALDEIAFATGRPVSPVPASLNQIRRAIAVHLDGRAPSAAPLPIDLPEEETPKTSDWLIPTAPGDTRWR
jgi:type IV pilus assembly protein PilB